MVADRADESEDKSKGNESDNTLEEVDDVHNERLTSIANKAIARRLRHQSKITLTRRRARCAAKKTSCRVVLTALTAGNCEASSMTPQCIRFVSA